MEVLNANVIVTTLTRGVPENEEEDIEEQGELLRDYMIQREERAGRL